MNNERIYYTYIYLDPRKPGIYQYGDYKFDYKPFYVGMGKNERILDHIYEAKQENIKVGNKHKYYKIKGIIKKGLSPIYFKLSENLTINSAIVLEIWLIWAIGRRDLKTGHLTNMTDGGEGSSGYIFTEELKKRLSKVQKKVWENNSELKTLARERNIGKKYSYDVNIKKGRKGNIHPNFGKPASEEAKRKMSESHKGKPSWNKDLTNIYSKETIEKMSKPKSEEAKRKMRESKLRLNYLKGNSIKAQNYIVTFPNGEIKKIRNMAQFCRENKLDGSVMSMVVRGLQENHKGFKAKKINEQN